MGALAFDLDTVVIPETQKFWAVFPGTGRRLFDAFQSENAVFLETPGLMLTEAVLKNDTLLRKNIAMSQAIAYWYRHQDVERESDKKPPSRNPDTYAVKRDGSFNAAVGNVRSLFFGAKSGDLVLVGGKDIYSQVLIGEFVGGIDPEHRLKHRLYGDEDIPYRKVRWLNPGSLKEQIQRRYFSKDLSGLFSNRKAVISIDRETYQDEIYPKAYGNYVLANKSRYVFEGARYNNNALSTMAPIKLLSYFISAYNAVEENAGDDFFRLNIDEGIAAYFEQDILNSFEIDFASPGQFTINAKSAVLALLAAVFVSATAEGQDYTEVANAKIGNSAVIEQNQAANSCVLEIQEKYKHILASMGATKYEELCRLNQESRAGVGLRVKVKKKNNTRG